MTRARRCSVRRLGLRTRVARGGRRNRRTRPRESSTARGW